MSTGRIISVLPKSYNDFKYSTRSFFSRSVKPSFLNPFVVIDHIEQRWNASVVVKPAFHMREESAQWRCAVRGLTSKLGLSVDLWGNGISSPKIFFDVLLTN